MRRASPRRRGAAIAVIVLLLVVVQAAVLTAASQSAGESDVAVLRIEAVRAFFAAESGFQVVVGEIAADRAVPVGEVAVPWGGAFEVIEISDPLSDAPLVIEGRSGAGRRRVEITVE